MWEKCGRNARGPVCSRTPSSLPAFIFPPRYWRRALGMQVCYVRHEDYQFCYSFRGRPGHRPSILMLHGFSAHKDMWLSVVKVQFYIPLSQEGKGFPLGHDVNNGRKQREPRTMAQVILKLITLRLY